MELAARIIQLEEENTRVKASHAAAVIAKEERDRSEVSELMKAEEKRLEKALTAKEAVLKAQHAQDLAQFEAEKRQEVARITKWTRPNSDPNPIPNRRWPVSKRRKRPWHH